MKRRAKVFRVLITILIMVLFFQGCNKLPLINNGSDISSDEMQNSSEIPYSSDTSDDETSTTSEIINIIDIYFSDKPSEVYKTPYIVIESYADLCVIYEYAQEYAGKRPKESYVLHIQGNVKEARINNLYPEEYFMSRYIIAALKKTESGSYTFECSAVKNDGEIIVNLHGTLPAVSSDDIGGYIYLVPVDGAYADESVKIVETFTKETLPAEYYYGTTSFADTTT